MCIEALVRAFQTGTTMVTATATIATATLPGGTKGLRATTETPGLFEAFETQLPRAVPPPLFSISGCFRSAPAQSEIIQDFVLRLRSLYMIAKHNSCVVPG